MAITFPTFEDTEILTAEKLNAWTASLQSKFDSGFGSTDINWPLVAEDHLYMGTGASGFEIKGGTKILKFINASAYDTLAAAVTAAGTSGCVFIPPNTTITTDGVTLGSGVSIIGAGSSSIIKANAGASYVLNTSNGGKSVIANLAIDGNNGTATAAGILMVGQDNSFIHNVDVYNCALNGIKLSQGCERMVISNCHFRAGADDQLFGDNVDNLVIQGCTFDSSAAKGINLTASGGGAYIRSIVIQGNTMRGCTEESIYVIGSGGYSANFEGIAITDNSLDGTSCTGYDLIVAGNTTGQLQDVTICGNQLTNAAQNAIFVWAKQAHVADNNGQDAGQHGCNCASSAYAAIAGNNFQGATNVGIVAANASTAVVVTGNILLSCNTAMTNPEAGYVSNNAGAPGPVLGSVLYSTGADLTIPANTLKTGDVIDVWHHEDITAAGGTGRVQLLLDGQLIGQTQSLTATGNRMIQSRVIITGPTGGVSQFVGHTNDRANNLTDRATVAGIDVTAAMTLTETHTNLTTTGGSIFTVVLHQGIDAS